LKIFPSLVKYCPVYLKIFGEGNERMMNAVNEDEMIKIGSGCADK
jgi:hypothetical protein